MADRDLEILDDFPNLDELILQEEIELVSSRLYNVARPKSEKGTAGKRSNLCGGFPQNDKDNRAVMSKSGGIMIKLSVTFRRAQELIEAIPHQRCRKGVVRHWKSGGNAGVTAQSICWLFCWAKTGMGSQSAADEARRVFNTIFDKSFDWFDAKVGYEWARAVRYTKKDIESEFQHRLQE